MTANITRTAPIVRSGWGMPNRDTATLFALLEASGFTAAEAESWCAALIPGTAEQVAATASLWRTASLSADQAARFCMSGQWLPHQAARFVQAGYEVAEANFVMTLLQYNLRTAAHSQGASDPSSATDWLDSGMSKTWILLCLGAGVTHVDQARDLLEEHRGDQTSGVLTRLDVEAALRRVNVRCLRLSPSAR